MRIFIYEFLTGGGLWHWYTEPPASLIVEGRSMVATLCADFLRLPEIEVQTTRDSRLPAFHPEGCQVSEVASAEGDLALLSYLASQADWTLIIAPETGGALAQRAGIVEMAGGTLLSPGSATVSIAANKQSTMEHLAQRHYPVPRGRLLSAGVAELARIPLPTVLKPVDGCGSQGVRLISSAAELPLDSDPALWRLEEYVPGVAVSVAILCGPKDCFALPACGQLLSSDGRFTYLGGRLPLPAILDGRARRLGLLAVSTLPPTLGYMGVDLVLGDPDDGRGDRIIEINPRLTTSYVGLRKLSETNLAAAMLAIAQGQPAELRFSNRQIEFMV